MKLPAYPHTKPSGVEWLGDVPEHWAHIALRRTSTRYAGGTPDRSNDSYWDEGTIPWINSGAVNQGLITEPSAFITEEAYRNSSARWVAKGALVMALAGQGKTKGMVAQTGIATTCNQSMAAICPAPPMEARYLYWLLVAQYEHIRNMAGGEARDGLNLEILGAIPCLKVPPAEQRSIAAFLDRETGRLDRLVAKKRELIERLKEKRTALISRTVTRGLPPAAHAAGLPANPTLKPSALDWLGDIPKHWAVLTLRRSIEFLTDYEANGSFADTKENVTIDSGEPFAWYVRATDLENKRAGLVEGNRYCDESTYRWLSKTALKGGELLVAKRGEIGKVYVMPIVACSATLAPNLYLIRLNRRLLPRYAWYWFSADPGNAELVLADKSTTIGALYKDDVKACFVLMPPLPEQAAIAAYLDLETAKLDALVGKVEEAVERLQEYRTALITAAVTGKIDVRKEVAHA